MKSLDDYKRELRAAFPWLPGGKIEHQAELDKRAADHKAQVGALLGMASDPERAFELWDKNARLQSTLDGQIEMLRRLLLANKLVTRDQLNITKAGYSHKAQHLGE
jgi:hypothetical protein